MQLKICTFFISLIPFFALNAQDIEAGLLFHLPVNGDIVDYSGSDFQLIGNFELAQDRLGNADGAMGFNGVDQFIDLPTDVSLKPPLPVSFAFWLYMDNTDATSAVFFATDFGTNMHSGAWMNISSNGRITISFGDASGVATANTRRSKQGESILEPYQWYYIVGVIRGPNDMDIYIDCENDGGDYNGLGGGIGYTANPGSLGRKYGTNFGQPYYFHGRIDDFRYYERALTMLDVDRLCLLNAVGEPTTVEEEFGEAEGPSVVKGIKLYPNPVQGTLYISGLDDGVDLDVEVRDLQGRLILQERVSGSLDVTGLSAGVYVLHVPQSAVRSARFVISN